MTHPIPHLVVEGAKDLEGDLGSSALMTESLSSKRELWRSQFESWMTEQGVSTKRVTDRPNASYTNFETHIARGAWEFLMRERAELQARYDELLYAVGKKFPDETRHQTALRYIRRMEEPSSEQASCAKASA